MKPRKAVYAGSFDPLTNGHLWMIEEGVKLFGELVVAVGVNPDKKCTFGLEERLEMLAEVVGGIDGVTVASFENKFLVRYARSVGATHILRGIRNENDYTFERTMRHVNGELDPGIATAFLMPPPNLADVSSSFVKGLRGPDGWEEVVKNYLPAPVYARFLKRFGHAE